MFGEKPLYGKDELKVDIKGRIFLPKYTKREKGDELVLLFDKETSKYEIYSIKRYNEIMDILQKYSLKALNKNDRSKYKERINEMCKSILKKIIVETQNRIAIGKIFPNTNKVLCTGVYDHLILEPIEDENIQKTK